MMGPLATLLPGDLQHFPTFLLELPTHLSQVFFDSCCNVLPSLSDEAQQILQLLEPELQRFGLPCLESPPGPQHSQFFPRHLQ